MKTNNREFIKLRNMTLMCMIIYIGICIWKGVSFFILGIGMFCIMIIYMYVYYLLIHFYQDVRNTIEYISMNKKTLIQDGDLGLLYDEVTQIKLRERAYEEKLENEKEKLRQTIEDICHQLKTPLTSISIYNELLLQDNQNNDYLQETDLQIQRMNDLISSLLKIAKLESHQVEFVFETLPIHEVVTQSLQSLHSLIEKSDVEIQTCLSDCQFDYDESWLQEALCNIIKNSLEHYCHKVTITSQDYENHLILKIHNDGECIADKDLEHIFERFYHSGKQDSIGIGLALAKEIIERHHGDIIVYNQDGVTFEIVFPKYQMNQKYQVS